MTKREGGGRWIRKREKPGKNGRVGIYIIIMIIIILYYNIFDGEVTKATLVCVCAAQCEWKTLPVKGFDHNGLKHFTQQQRVLTAEGFPNNVHIHFKSKARRVQGWSRR